MERNTLFTPSQIGLVASSPQRSWKSWTHKVRSWDDNTTHSMFRIRPCVTNRNPRYSSLFRPLCQARCYAGPGRPKGTQDNWAGEKLAINKDFPLTVALNERIHPTMLPKKTRNYAEKARGKMMSSVHVRTQIVSPGLCGTLA
jgi:hypothetical protein